MKKIFAEGALREFLIARATGVASQEEMERLKCAVVAEQQIKASDDLPKFGVRKGRTLAEMLMELKR